MDPKALRTKRADLLRQAQEIESRNFATEGDGATFDGVMRQIGLIDAQLRAAGEPLLEPAATGPVPVPAPAPPVGDAAARAAGAEAERQRIAAIHTAVRAAALDPAFGQPFIDGNAPIDAVRAAILEELATRQAPTDIRSQVPHASMGEDARDKFLRGAGNWLLVRSGLASLVARAANPSAPNVSAIDPGEFRGLTLLEMARMALERGGVPTAGMDKQALIGRAFTHRSIITQSTSDFATLLENVMHKVLQAQYVLAPNTWSKWCATSTVTDFRAHSRYRMGMFSALDSLTETGEFKNKAINDAEKATITAATKGNIINVSRQMVVNDDIGAFTRLLTMLGQAAALSVEVDAYALLALNSGLGPTQSDSQPLFHANRSNVGTGAALSAASIDADRVVMGSQRDPWGNVYLELRPSVLLLPLSLGGQARVINQSQYDPDTLANKSQMKPNVVAGLYSSIVDTARLTGTRRYSFADPSIAPVFEVAFLEGQTSPVLESRDGWRQDGTEMRVRFDYGVAAVDYRGAVTNAGA